jgi:hypothetical protein
MPYLIESLENMPILVITMQGPLNLHTMQSLFAACDDYEKQNFDGQHAYRIMDVRQSHVSSPEVFKFARHLQHEVRGFGHGENLTVIYVGDKHWVKFTTGAMQLEHFGGLNTPIFNTLDEAVGFAQTNCRDAVTYQHVLYL